MKKLQLIIAAACMAFTSAAHAQNFTGGIAVGGAGSYTSTSLTLATTSLFESGDGTFAGLSFGLVAGSNPVITGLSGTQTLPLAPTPIFEISSSTTPPYEYAFEMTSITPESIAGDYQGTGLFIDNQNVLTPTIATFTLGYAGPAGQSDGYSFSASVAQAVPEPSSWAMGLICTGFLVCLCRRIRVAQV